MARLSPGDRDPGAAEVGAMMTNFERLFVEQRVKALVDATLARREAPRPINGFYCKHCGERATFSRFLDEYWCAECRSVDVGEVEYGDA